MAIRHSEIAYVGILENYWVSVLSETGDWTEIVVFPKGTAIRNTEFGVQCRPLIKVTNASAVSRTLLSTWLDSE